MSDPKLNVWPNELMIRDTQIVHDDGSGRIYTTIGFGYVKEKYVRAVLVDALRAEVAALKAELTELRALRDRLVKFGNADVVTDNDAERFEAIIARAQELAQ